MLLTDFHSDLLKCFILHLDVTSQFMLKHTCKRMHGLISERHSSYDLVVCAAYRGYSIPLKYLLNLGCKVMLPATDAAAREGHVEILKLAKGNGYNWDSYTCTIAAVNGHLDVVKYLISQNAKLSSFSDASVIKNGRIEILEYLVSEGYPLIPSLC